jgi:hypothetical protein
LLRPQGQVCGGKMVRTEPLVGPAHFSFVSAASPPTMDEVRRRDRSLL